MLPKTMKAAVLHEFGGLLTIEKMPVKEPGENQVLVKVVTCGMYHYKIGNDGFVVPRTNLHPGNKKGFSRFPANRKFKPFRF